MVMTKRAVRTNIAILVCEQLFKTEAKMVMTKVSKNAVM